MRIVENSRSEDSKRSAPKSYAADRHGEACRNKLSSAVCGVSCRASSTRQAKVKAIINAIATHHVDCHDNRTELPIAFPVSEGSRRESRESMTTSASHAARIEATQTATFNHSRVRS